VKPVSFLVVVVLGLVPHTFTYAQAAPKPIPQGKGLSAGPYCGVYCVYAAVKLAGHTVSIESLLKPEYIGSSKGSTFAELANACKANGLHTMYLENLATEDLRRCAYPVILHLKSGETAGRYDHFGLFIKGLNNKALLFDPPTETRDIPWHELAAIWDGSGLVVSEEPIAISSILWPAVWKKGLWFSALFFVVAAARRFGKKSLFLREPWPFPLRVRTALVQCSTIIVVASCAGFVVNSGTKEGMLRQWRTVREIQEEHSISFVPKLKVKGVQEAIKRGAVLVDARWKSDYEAGHIGNALNIEPSGGAAEYEQAMQGWPTDHYVIVYCQSAGCPYSSAAAKHLQNLGYKNLALFVEGWEGWK